jgi:hypothetical protein
MEGLQDGLFGSINKIALDEQDWQRDHLADMLNPSVSKNSASVAENFGT